jgi:hypothetical protein
MPTPSVNDKTRAGRGPLGLAGGLLVGGLLLNLVGTVFHPAGREEDELEVIFTKYADSDAWVAIHLGQFIGILIALAGLLALYRAFVLHRDASVLARFAVGATIATAAALAVLQAVDGVALKQAVDAWTDASGAQKAIRFDNAETLRWLEWGIQSYFRVLLGISFVLFGVAIITTRLVAAWLGWVAVLAGVLSVAIGIDVGYSGLESGFQDAVGIAFLLALVAFGLGIGVTGAGRHPPAVPV